MTLRVVATYTTLPSRYNILKQSIDSLKNQTYKLDEIYLTIPNKSTRLNLEYPPVPDDIQKICTVKRIDFDYGPITKLYGALAFETDPNTVIISCDDDVIFEPNFVETLIKHHKKFPNSVICGTGALIGKGFLFISIVTTIKPFNLLNGFISFKIDQESGRKVDLIFGVAGVLYTRSMFPLTLQEINEELFNYSLKDTLIFCNDDVLISGYLSKKKIERRVFSDIPLVTHFSTSDALSRDIIKMINGLNKSISKVKELGFFPTTEHIVISEAILVRLFILSVLLIIISLLFLHFYKG